MSKKRTPPTDEEVKRMELENIEPAQVSPRKNGQAIPDRIRFEAGIVYTTDPSGISVTQLRDDPRFQGIAEKTLYKWCKEDKWVERRKAIFDKFRRRAENALSSTLAKARIKEIEENLEVKAIMLEHIRTGNAEPKSLEGLVKALIDLNIRREELAITVSAEALPGADSDGEKKQSSMPVIGTDEVSVEEIRGLVQHALKSRREHLRDELNSGEPLLCAHCGWQTTDAEEMREHDCKKSLEVEHGETETTVDT